MIKTECKTPFTGKIELISPTTGHGGVRLPSKPVEISAYIDGVIAEVIPDEGVVVETYGAFGQGIFGVGGERMGNLAGVVDSPDALLTEDHITEKHAGRVVVGGAGVTLDALRKAASVGVVGVVVGAIVDTALIQYLGHDIGVAITGHEPVDATLILTEGFGSIAMAARTFDLLKTLEGRSVSINGATQIRAGVIRPEIIAPFDEKPPVDDRPDQGQTLSIGTHIRVIRGPARSRHKAAIGAGRSRIRRGSANTRGKARRRGDCGRAARQCGDYRGVMGWLLRPALNRSRHETSFIPNAVVSILYSWQRAACLFSLIGE